MNIELSEQEQLRRQSLNALRELGINPYPAARYEVTATAREIAENFDPEKGNYQQVSIAGRIMSRMKAREVVSLDEFKESMDGIFTTSVSADTVDEAPMVYKPMDEIIENIKDTVDILEIIKPVYNFKASEG